MAIINDALNLKSQPKTPMDTDKPGVDWGRVLSGIGQGMSGFAAPMLGKFDWKPTVTPGMEDIEKYALIAQSFEEARLNRTGGENKPLTPSERDARDSDITYNPNDRILDMHSTMGGKYDSIQDAILKEKAIAPIKAAAKAKETAQSDILSAQKAAKGTYRAMQQYDRSQNELLKFDPSIGDEGMIGWYTRRKGDIANYFDVLPETQALDIQVKPLANGIARDIEGGKVTNEDREIYADAFAHGLKNPTSTNIRLMSNAIIDAIDKGAGESAVNMLKQFSNSNSDVFQNVVTNVIEEFPGYVELIFGKGAKIIDE